jgi:hypothetical protein
LITISLLICFSYAIKAQDSLVFIDSKPIEKIVEWNGQILLLNNFQIKQVDKELNQIDAFKEFSQNEVIDFINLNDTLYILSLHNDELTLNLIYQFGIVERELPNNLNNKHFNSDINKAKKTLKFVDSEYLEIITENNLYSYKFGNWTSLKIPDIPPRQNYQFYQPQDGICIIHEKRFYIGLFYGEFGGGLYSLNLNNPQKWTLHSKSLVTDILVEDDGKVWFCSGMRNIKTFGKLSYQLNNKEYKVFECYGYYKEPKYNDCDSSGIDIDYSCCDFFNKPLAVYGIQKSNHQIYILTSSGIYLYKNELNFEKILDIDKLVHPTCFKISGKNIIIGTDRYGLLIAEKDIIEKYIVKQILIKE